MRSIRLLVALLAATALTAWGVRDDEPEWPHSGPMPDNPVKVRPHRYESIGRGAQSYRPIAPMPWGDVNKRVAPPGSLPGGPPAKKGSAIPAPAQVAVPAAAVAPTSPATPASPAAVPAAAAPSQGMHSAPPAVKQ